MRAWENVHQDCRCGQAGDRDNDQDCNLPSIPAATRYMVTISIDVRSPASRDQHTEKGNDGRYRHPETPQAYCEDIRDHEVS